MKCANGCKRQRARSKSGHEYSYCRPCYNAYHSAYKATEEFILRRVEFYLRRVTPELRRRILRRLSA